MMVMSVVPMICPRNFWAIWLIVVNPLVTETTKLTDNATAATVRPGRALRATKLEVMSFNSMAGPNYRTDS